MSSAEELTDAELEVVAQLPASASELSDSCGVTEDTIRSRIMRVREKHGSDAIVYHRDDGQYRAAVDFDVEQEEQELGELNEREEYILKSLPATSQELADDLGIEEVVVDAHIDSIAEKGYEVEFDERTGTYHSEESVTLRSSEHVGQRTRAANKWWQKKDDELVREFRALETPKTEIQYEPGNQDFVSHLTDIHMGDLVHDDASNEVYNTEITQNVIEYITDKQLELYQLQSQLVDFDCWHELWGGDFLTNSGIYQGQWEDLDAWLDEQHDALVEPILKRLKAISEVAPVVNVVCKTGNHGEHRASGKSKQANADLIFYKHIRNTVSQLQKYGGLLQNVNFQIGSSAPYKNFEMRGGKVRGHLRHGQNRKPQAVTSKGTEQWSQTLHRHEFDIAYMGHVHTGKRLGINGKPVFVTGSPKPSGEFAEQIAAGDDDNIALCHGVSDDGLTFTYPIDLRDFKPIST
ncbi:hypothetical protein JMJ58_03725 [Haloterrigena salifodinae]|uniref:Uncharacterized protein n=1 Tax=Haloterrigena salifodinae TaxID=2675099 RepID=A0A8T8E2N7_9EURY|nr:hypothetical protein [Haloterrigena salifodinae]QRV16018.1 hypothetical protein JMJ58_03725 [Haloterrigena salifodinae]